mmetsp:Transcript_16506/g.23089  ORF Transcript_16506/g.23089 Transcript_16506/m.23089 type:complete len:194 (-) Transcript_16506:302-883(-)
MSNREEYSAKTTSAIIKLQRALRKRLAEARERLRERIRLSKLEQEETLKMKLTKRFERLGADPDQGQDHPEKSEAHSTEAPPDRWKNRNRESPSILQSTTSKTTRARAASCPRIRNAGDIDNAGGRFAVSKFSYDDIMLIVKLQRRFRKLVAQGRERFKQRTEELRQEAEKRFREKLAKIKDKKVMSAPSLRI